MLCLGNTNTLVIRYRLTPEIKKLHQICLNILIQFFKICGIDNVETFMNLDPNFKNALTIKPHLTVAKAYSGELPSLDVENINASLMKILQ